MDSTAADGNASSRCGFCPPSQQISNKGSFPSEIRGKTPSTFIYHSLQQLYFWKNLWISFWPLPHEQGMTLIRVLRDDNFLKQMLLLIRRFYTSYVRQRKLPPQDMFFQRNDYQVCRPSLIDNVSHSVESMESNCKTPALHSLLIKRASV